MIRRPPRSTLSSSSAASDVYKRQIWIFINPGRPVMRYVMGKITPTALCNIQIGDLRNNRRTDIITVSNHNTRRVILSDGFGGLFCYFAVNRTWNCLPVAKLVIHILTQTWFVDQVEAYFLYTSPSPRD